MIITGNPDEELYSKSERSGYLHATTQKMEAAAQKNITEMIFN